MIVSEKDAIARLESPGNLINRLRSAGSSRRDAMGLFGVNGKTQPINGNGAGLAGISGAGSDIKPILPKIEVPAFVNPFDKNATPATALVPSRELPATIEPKKEEPNLDNLLDNADSRIKLSLAHDKALDTLVSAVETMHLKLDDIRPDKLPSVIAATSKVVDQIQRQRIDANKVKGGREVHFHFYTPTQKKLEEYEVIDVG